MNFALQRKIHFGFAGLLLMLAVVSFYSYRSIRQFARDDDLNDHTHQVLATIADLGSLMKDIETGARGYVITGDERYLEPFNTARDTHDAALQHLRHLTADNPPQQSRLAQL